MYVCVHAHVCTWIYVCVRAEKWSEEVRSERRWIKIGAREPNCEWPCKEFGLDYKAIEGFLRKGMMRYIGILEILFLLESSLMKAAREETFFIWFKSTNIYWTLPLCQTYSLSWKKPNFSEIKRGMKFVAWRHFWIDKISIRTYFSL